MSLLSMAMNVYALAIVQPHYGSAVEVILSSVASSCVFALALLQEDKDKIDLQVDEWRRIVSGISSRLKDRVDQKAAAQELLADADKRLEKPRRPGMPSDSYVAPTDDKRQAEAVLANCAQEIPRLEERMAAARASLATWEEKQKNFDMEGLRREQHQAELRRRMGCPRNRRHGQVLRGRSA